MTRFPAFSFSILAAGLVSTTSLCAQSSTSTAAPATSPSGAVGDRGGLNPRPAEAAIGPTGYRSVFTDYRSYSEQAVVSWRESNQLVGDIGGWRSYAREAQSGIASGGSESPSRDAAPAVDPKSAAPAGPPAGAAGGHTGHSKP